MRTAPTVDTRFFLTHFLADQEPLREKTRLKIAELQRQRAIVPTIVVHEVYKFEYENLGKDVAQLRVDTILKSSFKIVELTVPIAISAALLRCRYRSLPTSDSIIAATAIELESKSVLSDDPHFEELEEIRAEWI